MEEKNGVRIKHIRDSVIKHGMALVKYGISYPELDENAEINNFYGEAVKKYLSYIEKVAGSKEKELTSSDRRRRIGFAEKTIMIMPAIRYKDKSYFSVTLDILQSEGKKTELYLRIGQTWDLRNNRLCRFSDFIKDVKKYGRDAEFYIKPGKIIIIENEFKDKNGGYRHIEDYIKETEIENDNIK